MALNRKIIDIAQRNINSGFDHAKSLAGAKNLAEAIGTGSSAASTWAVMPPSRTDVSDLAARME